jgi:hypothetical protein
MNTEQAIAYLEECIQRQNAWCDYTGVKEMRLAIEALREKAVRSKGCEYCDDNFKFWQTQISGELPNVRYCPMCGRKLDHN